MARVHADEFFVPPGHLKALEDYMAQHPGDWHIVNADPAMGEYALHGAIGGTQRAIINITLDIEPILNLNTEIANNSQGQKWGDGQVFARIPLGLRHSKGNELKGLGIAADLGDMKYVKKVLNSNEFRKLRTFEGNL